MREMEYFVFYKSLRDHRQVEDHSISPPWCLTIKASGHTFASGSEVYMPKIELDSRNLVSGLVTALCCVGCECACDSIVLCWL